MFHSYYMHTLKVHKNYHADFLCFFGHALYKSWYILSSGNIIIAFSTLSVVGSLNFMLVACLVWPENKLQNFAIYCEKTHNKWHFYISDDCTATINYLKLKLLRIEFEIYLTQLVKFHQNQRWWSGDP